MLAQPYMESNILGLKLVRRGKVRDIYEVDNQQLLMVTTDRISAFDYVLPTGIPDKGRVLNELSNFWKQFLNVPHDINESNVDRMPYFATVTDRAACAGRATLVCKTKVIPFECVVRGYLAGSGLKEYRKTGSICGIPLPAGLQEGARLPQPIFTPATKAETGHDINITFEEMCDRLQNHTLADRLRHKSLDIYTRGAAHALRRGIIIADTKFEWGHCGKTLLIDEVLTPDSSRFWPVDQYVPGSSPPSFDKQFVRNWLTKSGWDKNSPPPPLPQEVVEQTRTRYIQAYEQLLDLEFPWK